MWLLENTVQSGLLDVHVSRVLDGDLTFPPSITPTRDPWLVTRDLRPVTKETPSGTHDRVRV